MYRMVCHVRIEEHETKAYPTLGIGEFLHPFPTDMVSESHVSQMGLRETSFL